MIGSRHVVLSCDDHENYSFFAPLTSFMFVEAGFHPIVFLVGTESAWLSHPRKKLVVEVTVATDGSGNATSTAAQVVRLYASALDLPVHDYLLTSDVDMWPVGSWVGSQCDESKDFQIYFSNAYEGAKETYVHYPMCYVGGRVAAWREVMGIHGDLRESLAAALATCRQVTADPSFPESSYGREWNFDEWWFGKKLSEWSGYPDRCQKIPREMERFLQRRMDRSAWPAVPMFEGVADAHLLRPGFTDAHWPRIRPLLQYVLNKDDLRWTDAYHKAWMDA